MFRHQNQNFHLLCHQEELDRRRQHTGSSVVISDNDISHGEQGTLCRTSRHTETGLSPGVSNVDMRLAQNDDLLLLLLSSPSLSANYYLFNMML